MRNVLRVALALGVATAALAAACSDDETKDNVGGADASIDQDLVVFDGGFDSDIADQVTPPLDSDIDAGPKCKTASCALTIAAGANYTCAVLGDHTVRCWGDNAHGELGIGALDGGVVQPSTSAGLQSVPNLDSAIAIAAGSEPNLGFTCALLTTGAVRCWGSNNQGQLGGAAVGTVSVDGGVLPADASAAAIELGYRHGCLIDTAGALRCWGTNGNNERSDAGLFGVVGLPLDSGIASLSAGYYDTCVVSAAGNTVCFGHNQTGQSNPTTNAAKVGMSFVDAGAPATSVSAGVGFTCASLAGDAGVSCWGTNTAYQLGRPGTVAFSAPGSPAFTPGIEPLSVTAGTSHACAIMQDRGVTCWGANAKGQSGDFTLKNPVTTPYGVGGISKAVQLAIGQEHACALNDDGEIHCWGSNAKGQLGPGANADAGADNNPHPDPVKVPL